MYRYDQRITIQTQKHIIHVCDVIFSHGLTGSRELNTSLCMDLASMGFYVFSVEHTDGSCALARFIDGTVIQYDFSHREIERRYGLNALHNARRKQTCTRVKNLKAHFDLINKLNSGYFVESSSYNLDFNCFIAWSLLACWDLPS